MNTLIVTQSYKDQLASICESEIYQPVEFRALDISPWEAMSLLQKAIRRGEENWALSAAATLLSTSPERLWRRFAVIAFEDIGVADIDRIGMTVAALSGKRFRRQIGGEWHAASVVVRLLCRSVKCRAADDLSVLADWRPSNTQHRDALAELSPQQLAQLCSDQTLDIEQRAIALWYLVGTKRCRAAHLTPNHGDPELAFEVLSDLKVPSTVVEICRLGLKRSSDILAPLTALLWTQHCGKRLTSKSDDRESDALVRGIPTWTYDKHVREGRRAIGRLLKANHEFAAWIDSVEAPWGKFELAGGMLFRIESGVVDNRLQWLMGKELQRRADYELHGPSADQIEIGYQLLRQELPHLHDLRREAVSC
jgi:hypothetical protein